MPTVGRTRGMKHILTLGFAALATILMLQGAASPAHVVHLKDFAFQPSVMTIDAGQRVMFENSDDEAHTVTATDKSFDSAGLDSGQTWSHVFARPGTYTYFCALHPYMKGKIIVRAGERP